MKEQWRISIYMLIHHIHHFCPTSTRETPFSLSIKNEMTFSNHQGLIKGAKIKPPIETIHIFLIIEKRI